MGFVRDLRHLLGGRPFRELFAVRVTSQCGDGVFQVALASYVLFSPERQPDAAAIAYAAAAVLLPFTLLGPFAGVFLDRWNRRQILALANIFRTLPVLAAGLVIRVDGSPLLLFIIVILALSVNRFLLAGLSAALPRVVARHELVLANAITPTCGTIAFMGGLALATGLRRVSIVGDGDTAIVVLAAVVYLAAGGLALRIPVLSLGPDAAADHQTRRGELRRVVSGLGEGVRHLRERSPAAVALGVIAAFRLCYGLSTVATILLYRNYFNDPADTDAALTGLSLVVLASGAGFFVAALVTPVVTARVSISIWMVTLLVVAAAFEAFPGGLYTEPALLAAAFVLGLSAQGLKICVDTLVQTHVDDEFRGRVFALYDVVFNLTFVLAAAIGALVIPPNGKSYGVLVAISLGYATTAVAYAHVAVSTEDIRTRKRTA